MSIANISAMDGKKYLTQQLLLENGLSSNRITDVAKDLDGIYWIGTDNGLNCLIEGATISDTGRFFENNSVQAIEVDKFGQIWVIVAYKLYLFDRQSMSFNIVQCNDLDVYARSGFAVDDGLVFFSQKYIYKYDYETKRIESIKIEEDDSTPFVAIGVSIIDNERIAIMERSNDIYVYNLKSRSLNRIENISLANKRVIRDIFVDSSQRIWVPIYGKGLYCYSLDGELIRTFDEKSTGISLNIVLDIVEMDNNLWIATDGGGVNVIDLESFDVDSFSGQLMPNISGQIVSSMKIYFNNSDDIWVGTVRNGLINIKTTYINNFNLRKLYSWRDRLNSSTIVNITESKSGDLWLGIYDDGVACYRPANSNMNHLESTAGMKVSSIVDLNDDYILISLYNGGICRVNKHTGAVLPVVIVDRETDDDIKNYDVSIRLVRLDDSRVLIYANKLYLYNIETNKIGYAPNGNLGNNIGFVLSQSDSVESVVHTNSDIYSVDHRTFESVRLYHNLDQRIVMVRKSGDILWIVQDQSLFKYDISTELCTLIDSPYNGSINTVELDHRGYVWVSTYDRLICLDADEPSKYFIFDTADGYMCDQYRFDSSMVTQSGDIYMGGLNGFLCVDSQLQIKRDSCRQVNLLSINLDEDRVVPTYNDSNQSAVNVPWDYTSLNLNVHVVGDNAFSQNQFRYTLYNSSKQSVVLSDNMLSLPTLTSGLYRVCASYMMNDGQWSSETHIVDVVVSTPWWRSNVAYSLLALFVLGLVVLLLFLYAYRKRQILLREHEYKEQELTRERVKFLVNISHELRTPLTLVYAPLKRLVDRGELNESLRRELSAIFVQSRYMSKLINMVLNLRKLEAGYDELNIRSHNLNRWVEEISEDFRAEMKCKGIELKYDLDESISVLNFDADKCRSILSNLLMNAYKYTDSAGETVVQTRMIDDHVRISIVDQGIGLEGVDVDALFDRFVQKHKRSNGTGIGLSYSKMLIELHRGSIGAFSNASNGSTFYFEIPMNLRCQTVGCENRDYLSTIFKDRNECVKQSFDYPLSSHSILVVDDNKDLRNFMRDAMRPHFKSVYIASDGIEALTSVRNYQPDIVLSDIVMPRMDGYELCSTIKNDINISHIPVILITSNAEPTNRTTGYKLGADGYIQKPFEVDEIVDAVRNQLHSRSMIKRRYSEAKIISDDSLVTFSNADEQFLFKLNLFIKNNIANSDLNISMMIDHMCMSRAVFYKKLSSIINIGAMEYVTKQRMCMAAQMLVSTDTNILDIAISVGYNNNQYFSKIFKSHYNCTPSSYRKNRGESL